MGFKKEKSAQKPRVLKRMELWLLEPSLQNGDNKLKGGVNIIYAQKALSQEPGTWQVLSKEQLILTRGGSGWA